MAWTLDANLGSAASGAGSDNTTAFNTAADVAAGSWVYLVVAHWTTASATLLSVSGGLGWNVLTPPGENGSFCATLVRAYAPSGLASGTAITATFSDDVASRGIGGAAFAGGAPDSPIEEIVTTSNGTAAHAVAPASVSAGALFIEGAVSEGLTANTPDANSTESVDKLCDFSRMLLQYRIGGAAGAHTVGGTWAVLDWAAAGVAAGIELPPTDPPEAGAIRDMKMRGATSRYD